KREREREKPVVTSSMGPSGEPRITLSNIHSLLVHKCSLGLFTRRHCFFPHILRIQTRRIHQTGIDCCQPASPVPSHGRDPCERADRVGRQLPLQQPLRAVVIADEWRLDVGSRELIRPDSNGRRRSAEEGLLRPSHLPASRNANGPRMAPNQSRGLALRQLWPAGAIRIRLALRAKCSW
ncbi:hypothetical protein PENTCL1PPCAC_9462, partial [Pristionchus entomophagus]